MRNGWIMRPVFAIRVILEQFKVLIVPGRWFRCLSNGTHMADLGSGLTNRSTGATRRKSQEPASQRLNSAERSLLTTASSPYGGSMITFTRLLL